MKNGRKCYGIIAMAAVIGFLTAACDNGNGDGDGDGGGNDGNGVLGATLNLNAQVYTVEDWSENYKPFTGDRVVNSNLGVSGSITNGQLNFTIGTPNENYLERLSEFFDYTELWNFPSISPADARGCFLSLYVSNDSYFGRGYEIYSGTEKKGSFTEGNAEYIYVDRDVTLSANRNIYYYDDGDSWTFNAYDITLKEGWNILHNDSTVKWSNYNVTSSVDTVSHKDPSKVRWVLNEWDNYYYSMKSRQLSPQSSRRAFARE